MKKWLQSAAPALLVAVLIAAVALGGGPGVNPLNRVNRDGDTMQGVLRVTQKGTGLVTLSADPTVAAGEGAGSGLFMKTGAPNIFMINTGLSGTTQRAYQILINVSRVLEVSSLADDGSNPQTLCQFDYYTGGATPEFSCVTIIGTKQFASSQVSGSNGFVCNTNGCRIDYGSGANDYASSDGTTVTFAGPVTETGAFNATGAAGDITLGGGDLTSSLATQTFNIISATNGTTATASIGTITLSPSATLGANDLVLNVQSVTGGTNLFTVDLEGDAVLVATMTAGNFIATGTTIPANGMYLPSASTVGFAANGVIEATLSATNFNPGANTGNSLGGAGIEWLQSNIRNMVVSSNGGLINEGATTVLTAAAAITTLINSDITAANASTTNAAFQLTTGRALDANDLLFSIATSVPTRVFTVDNEGDVVAGAITSGDTRTRGTITLSSGTGTATIISAATCVCVDTTANASVKCTVVTTTLTATGTASDVIAYLCL